MQLIAYTINKSSTEPLYIQLIEQIKYAIHEQRLQKGDKLPSKRRLSQHLQISQNTIETAYSQLMAEGYIESVPKVGFFVNVQAGDTLLSKRSDPNKNLQKMINIIPPKSKKYCFDFNPNRIDSRHFPFEKWKKLNKKILNKNHSDLLHLNDPQGDQILREQLANYLNTARGVQCEAEQIVLTSGVEQLLQILMILFEKKHSQTLIYGIETFGYRVVENIFKLYQKYWIKLPLEPQSKRLDVASFLQKKIDVAYITPSHQYPFGGVLNIEQRQQLLEWVKAEPSRYLIEDDYDGEFRYQGKPIPSLQSLDRADKVIYFGSLSKLLMPAIRISFMVLPKSLLSDYQPIKQSFNCSVSRFDQQIVSLFIQQGFFEQHINRMRKRYRNKMEQLCRILTLYHDTIRYYGESSGFYLLIELIKDTRSSKQLVALAEQDKIKIYPIDWQNKQLFVLGFGDLSEEELERGIKKLLSSWGI
ncbi:MULTISPECIES: PLP-dependent aminotransferase family protein [Pasteurellaceae]|uniref:PLP-dependent aminotransferase family protein n=1 Tax=Pasteurella atlantica TaxID=2827233 RepID=A0AAW8CGR1_9PAST|nr:PLP-dependent aminotransferase family protein [Pasteurella atlantica]MBR0573246.1 PLP-dependent aminotransferase family protein [Pasteurella atlantica]MDP8039138.1 PLP-dependent aminotransferase family protein [Pasteurella atlantica]MDP8043400.1 PLP-dependent aminotransferase family protein [Pasteurella atlantica]MDP8045486.1 PLP-dependent aminotransferase family protein [Pasteurella atlantica]MDP8061304.1 PLP-dependent aminotransferase family protein [Pasteurella atlantica]